MITLPPHPPPAGRSERVLLFLLGAVQFVNALEFMIVMPLGPDFSRGLGIPVSHVGWIGGAYTLAAAVSGMVGSLFLDRFDRRKALAVAMLGLVIGTALGGFARGLVSLMAARVIAGMFGGPATSLSLSIIADVIPVERRGKAMGAVMGAFSVASVLGVPAGLELARLGSWRTPLFAVAGMGVMVAAAAIFLMPPLRKHLDAPHPPGPRGAFFRDTAVLAALASTATVMVAAFSIIPNISAFLQFNYGYPRARLGLLYMIGGAVNFFAMRLIGYLVDRFGAAPVSTFGTVLFGAILWFGYIHEPFLPPLVVFTAFMLGMSFRNVPLTTLSSRVPAPRQRARFMSTQSAVQHLSASAGAFLSAHLLTELPDGRLVGMEQVAGIALALSLALPFLITVVQTRVRRREHVEEREVGADF